MNHYDPFTAAVQVAFAKSSEWKPAEIRHWPLHSFWSCGEVVADRLADRPAFGQNLI